MIEGIPRISVRVITYKQEELIKRAINSLLAQKDYIYEICVSDDCSPDHTWEVLQRYSKDNPGLFKLNRNEKNLGIFENIEKTWTMPTGDLVYNLSGDDECPNGWFQTVVEYILKYKIDYKNELFCIYGDYKAIYPNGDSFIAKNRMIEKYPNRALTMSFRGILGSRSACFSKKVLHRFERISQGKSFIVEDAQDRQLQVYSEHNYYIPAIGNVYYARIGVGVNSSNSVQYGRSDVFRFSYNFYMGKGMLSKRDAYFLLYRDVQLHYLEKKSFALFCKLIYYHLKSIIWKFDYGRFQIQRVFFAIRRRLPHKQPLCKEIG